MNNYKIQNIRFSTIHITTRIRFTLDVRPAYEKDAEQQEHRTREQQRQQLLPSLILPQSPYPSTHCAYAVRPGFLVVIRIVFYCIILSCFTLYWIVLHCMCFIVLSCHNLSCVVLRCPALCCVTLHCVALPCFVSNFATTMCGFYCFYCKLLHFIILHCIALHCIASYCIVLFCIVLYCIVLYCIVYAHTNRFCVVQEN